ncbi:uncharacterized protein AKAME5_002959500 [Lates japonicus]|uniref:Uncharacterized protein n=1 Tax=Lates japonicus TaxID=270547 RepID=A0AAD3M704_LATJO|nr:uncharacterized protein AKAME5_002959500 [Lates japonicus]
MERDTWEQSVPEPVTQVEGLCPDSLASVSIPPSMPSPEPPGSPSQYRSTSRGSSMGSVSSNISLHPWRHTLSAFNLQQLYLSLLRPSPHTWPCQ